MMKTELLQATPQAIARAGAMIRRGQVVGFPTETVYGLGADALNPVAVLRIFEAKGRPADNPLIVHIAALCEAAALMRGAMPEKATQLAQAFWPGPLTMVFEKSALVPDAVSADLPTVGIRMPAHPVALALIRAAGTPIAAPSANRSGRPSPTSAEHVLLDMDGRVPLILDGGRSAVGLESTVLDMTAEVPTVLRPGGVTPEMIAKVIGEVHVDERVQRPLNESERPSSPGMKYRHYAPQGELSIVLGEAGAVASRMCALYDAAEGEGKRACILALTPNLGRYGARRTCPLGANADEAAHALFHALRQMDERHCQIILAEGFEAQGLGLALMNRLARAAAFRLIDAGRDEA